MKPRIKSHIVRCILDVYDSVQCAVPSVKELSKRHSVPLRKVWGKNGKSEFIPTSPGGVAALTIKTSDPYHVGYHELVHWTGDSTLLNREHFCPNNRAGYKTYAKEEIIAELGCAVLSLGSGSIKLHRHIDYIDGFLDYGELQWVPKQCVEEAKRAVEYLIK